MTDSILNWDADNDPQTKADEDFEKDFQQAAEVPKACAIDDEGCQACQ